MAAYATFTKFNGSWAIRVEGPIKAGETVQTRKASGEVKTVEVLAVLSTRQGVSICSFRDAQAASTPRGSTRNSSTRGTTRKTKSSRKSEGVTSSEIVTVRETQSGDTLGRRGYINIRGVRTPCIVIGWDTRYVREDGLSFGMPADEGWFTTSYHRLATPEEAAEMEATANERKAAKAAEEEAKKNAEAQAKAIAEAPLQGLSHCDMTPTPTGDWSTVGEYENVRVSKVTLIDNTVIYVKASSGYDDYRTTIYADEATLNRLREEFVNSRGDTYTKTTAEEFLAKYRGCVGTGFYEWLLNRET